MRTPLTGDKVGGLAAIVSLSPQRGDEVQCEIEQLGVICNRVV